MKKNFKDIEFSGLVIQKKQYDFLKNQKDVEYSHLYDVFTPFTNYHNEEINEELLSNYESLYGNPNLWNVIYGDKEFQLFTNRPYSHEECMKLLQRYIRFTEAYLEESKPDYVIMENVVSMPSYILFLVAKRKGIKVRIFNVSRISRRTILSKDPFVGFEDVLDTFHGGKEGIDKKFVLQAEEYISAFRDRKIDLDYVTSPEKHAKKNYVGVPAIIGRIPRAFDLLRQDLHYSKKRVESFDKDAGFISKIYSFYRRHKSMYQTKMANIFDEPVIGENYVFFPLHMQPEMSTLIRAPMYSNQLFAIENLSKSIPITYKLYVKDHPLTFSFGHGWDLSFYKKIKRLPNVRLLKPSLDSHSLIKQSRLVAVITGTAGWEAALLKKPVITFGKVFYNCLSGVTYCNNINQLPQQIFETLKKQGPEDEELIRLCASIYRHSFEGDYLDFCGLNGWLSVDQVLRHPDFNTTFKFLSRNLGLIKK